MLTLSCWIIFTSYNTRHQTLYCVGAIILLRPCVRLVETFSRSRLRTPARRNEQHGYNRKKEKSLFWNRYRTQSHVISKHERSEDRETCPSAMTAHVQIHRSCLIIEQLIATRSSKLCERRIMISAQHGRNNILYARICVSNCVIKKMI